MIDWGKFDRTDNMEFYEEIVMLAMRGLSLKECGDYYGLDEDDWKEWCEEHPMTESRHNTGKVRGVALAGAKLLQQVKDGKSNSIFFYLKTLGGFTEKSVMKLEDSLKVINMQIPVIPIDPVEASKVYQQFMRDS